MRNGRDLGRGRGCPDPAAAELSAVCVRLCPKADTLALAPSSPLNPIPRPPPPSPRSPSSPQPQALFPPAQGWPGNQPQLPRLHSPGTAEAECEAACLAHTWERQEEGDGEAGFALHLSSGLLPATHGCPGLETSCLAEGRGSPPGRSPALPPESESSSLQRLPPRPRQNPQGAEGPAGHPGSPQPLPAGQSRGVWGQAPGTAPGGGHAPHLTPLSPGLPAQEASPFFRPAPVPRGRGDTTPYQPPPALQETGAGAGGRGLPVPAGVASRGLTRMPAVALGSGSEGPEVRQPQRRREPECDLELAQLSYLTSAWDSPRPPPRPPRPRVPLPPSGAALARRPEGTPLPQAPGPGTPSGASGAHRRRSAHLQRGVPLP